MTNQNEAQFLHQLTQLMQEHEITETVVITRSTKGSSNNHFTCHLLAKSEIDLIRPGTKIGQLCSKLMHSILMGVTRILNEEKEKDVIKNN